MLRMESLSLVGGGASTALRQSAPLSDRASPSLGSTKRRPQCVRAAAASDKKGSKGASGKGSASAKKGKAAESAAAVVQEDAEASAPPPPAPRQTRVASVKAAAPVPPPAPSYPGTPLFWVGIGVALSVFFNWLSKKLYQQAQQAMMRQMMEAMKAGGAPGGGPSPFGGAPPFGGASPFGGMGGAGSSPFGGMPFPPPPSSSASATASSPASKASPVDVSATFSESNGSAKPSSSPAASPKPASAATSSAAGATSASGATSAAPPPTPTATPSAVIEPDLGNEPPKSSSSSFFQDTDVTQESTASAGFGGYSWANAASSSSSSSSTGEAPKGKMTVEALERMLEDPTIQQMILPYLPEEMRDPATFKWMLQSPIYRSQLEQMLEGGASGGFDPRVVEMMQNFDLNSPEVQAQFSQMGMTPEQVVSKIMSDPQLAAAFQNPRIQAAILDVSTNPYNIAKYSNDKEFMEVFQKMQSVFPVP